MPLEASITAGSWPPPEQNSTQLDFTDEVIHRLTVEPPASAVSREPELMRQYQRIRLIGGGLGLTLIFAFWQQSATLAHAAEPQSSPSPNVAWTAPLEPPLHLVNQYLQPNSDYSAGHRGVDYAVTLGQVILAPTAGRIAFAGTVVNRSVVTLRTSVGELIEFEPACTDLTLGTEVEQAQPIALVCEPDPSYHQHCPAIRCLHYSLRNSNGYLSPLTKTFELAPSVLLPRTGFSF